MAENRRPAAFCREFRNDDDLIYVVPEGNALVYGDNVIVGANQKVRFSAGGKVYWFTRPDAYTVCYDKRSEAEILLANMSGETLGNLPMLVNTGIIFCCMRERTVKASVGHDIMINRMVGMKPEFRMVLQTVSAEKLLDSIDPGRGAMEQVMEEIGRNMEATLRQNLRDAGKFDEYSVMDEVREMFANEDWAEGLKENLNRETAGREYFGVYVKEIEVTDWGLWNGYCDECGVRVGRQDRFCKNRHLLQRCPECRELIYDKRCLVNGHAVLYCDECGEYVTPKNGRCPVHRNVCV